MDFIIFVTKSGVAKMYDKIKQIGKLGMSSNKIKSFKFNYILSTEINEKHT